MSNKTRKTEVTEFRNNSSNAMSNALAEKLQPDTYEAIDVTFEDFVQPLAALGFFLYIPSGHTGDIAATPVGNSSAVVFTTYTTGAYLREAARFSKVSTAGTSTTTGLEAWY